jgi:hypothetical protein
MENFRLRNAGRKFANHDVTGRSGSFKRARASESTTRKPPAAAEVATGSPAGRAKVAVFVAGPGVAAADAAFVGSRRSSGFRRQIAGAAIETGTTGAGVCWEGWGCI